MEPRLRAILVFGCFSSLRAPPAAGRWHSPGTPGVAGGDGGCGGSPAPGVRACSGRRSKRQSFLGGELSEGAILAGQAHRCWGNTVKVQSLGGSPAEECSIKAMSPA